MTGLKKITPFPLEIRISKKCYHCTTLTKEYITYFKCPFSPLDVSICLSCFNKKYRIKMPEIKRA